jgi:DegT/DnrJ/EryC1/StrS aminotransferase family
VLGSLPQSEKAADEVVSLPLYPEMTSDQLEMVAQAVLSALEDVAKEEMWGDTAAARYRDKVAAD